VTQNIQVSLIPDILYDENDKAFNIILEEPKGGASLDLSHCMVTMLCDEECALVQFAKDAYPFMGKWLFWYIPTSILYFLFLILIQILISKLT